MIVKIFRDKMVVIYRVSQVLVLYDRVTIIFLLLLW